MNLERLVASLDAFSGMLPAALAGLAAEDVRWRPADGSWSILEVVSHLADEETLDFRPRLESTLRDPAAAWAPIDPEGWATERRYNDGSLPEVLERFLAARRDSAGRLRALEHPDWERAREHPRAGPLRAGDLLAAWVAHDMLHLRQIVKRRYQLIVRDAAPYEVAYAGTWRG